MQLLLNVLHLYEVDCSADQFRLGVFRTASSFLHHPTPFLSLCRLQPYRICAQSKKFRTSAYSPGFALAATEEKAIASHMTREVHEA